MTTFTGAVSDFPAGFTPAASDWGNWSDALQALTDAWTSYTPTLGAGGGSPAIGNGTLTGRYYRSGKKVGFEILLVAGSSTNFGTGAITLTLPVAVRSGPTFKVFSNGHLYDASAPANYPMAAVVGSGGTALSLRQWPNTASNPFSSVTGTSPVTLATTDELMISGEYEAT